MDFLIFSPTTFPQKFWLVIMMKSVTFGQLDAYSTLCYVGTQLFVETTTKRSCSLCSRVSLTSKEKNGFLSAKKPKI